MAAASSSLPTSTSGYVCDTLPPARISHRACSRSPSPVLPPTPPVPAFKAPITDSSSPGDEHRHNYIKHSSLSSQIAPPPGRKLCVRHQRMADEGTNLRLQQALDALPVEDRSAVSTIWSTFSSSPHPRRALILHGLLTMCCFSQLSLLSDQLAHLIRIDPFSVLPSEVCLKILGYLDATSLCRAAQVSKKWKNLADDDVLWRGICEQHIGQKCLKCGWGLPILEKRRVQRLTSPPLSSTPGPETRKKREVEPETHYEEPPMKRQRPMSGEPDVHSRIYHPSPTPSSSHTPPVLDAINPLLPPAELIPSDMFTRPWKDVYCERLTIERNWRRGRCTVRTLTGHTDGVMCLQFSETLSHPAFPVLITGSYDRTARVWNLDTGREVLCMTGHTRAVRALQFDEVKLITGSMDHTIKVWDWRTGKCLRTLEGHTEGVVCLNFDQNVLASGSVDTTVKVWNFRTGECFTLRGHRDWVNAVQLWNSLDNTTPGSCTSEGSSSPLGAGAPHIDPGKMLFSASDDGSIRLWDLVQRTCVRQLTGHVGQVQSLKLIMLDEACGSAKTEKTGDSDSGESTEVERALAGSSVTATPLDTPPASPPGQTAPTLIPPSGIKPYAYHNNLSAASDPQYEKEKDRNKAEHAQRVRPVLISGSLDNTIKVWDLESNKCPQTLFGHIEGIWAVASDKLRLVSGSHDRTIKVWSRDDGHCTATLVGHRGAVTCLALGEDKIVSGSDDGDIRVWSFSS